MSGRNWCFVWNNPTTTQLEWPSFVRYAVWQYEVGEETGTPHLQGYVEFSKLMRLSGCRKILNKANWRTRYKESTRDQARDYCLKERTRIEGPWEHGQWVKDGERTDLQKVTDKIKDGASLKEIFEEAPETTLKYTKNIQTLRALYDTHQDSAPQVHVRWGEPGSGKTRFVYDNHTDVYAKPDGDWFDGYEGQEVVIFDDFYGGIKYNLLLRLLDRYPLKVPIKGGFVNWRPRIIYITSNVSPEDWYPNIADKRALMRRITSVTQLGDTSYEGHHVTQTELPELDI